MTVAFMGLGAMGVPMAARLAARHQTVVWNRTPQVANAHASRYGTASVTLEEAAGAEVIFSCLPTTAEVAEVVAGSRRSLREGSLWIDCTSGDPADAEGLRRLLAQRAVSFLDAPVSGMAHGAEAGTLTVMVGGDADAFTRARPYLSTFGEKLVHVGPTGSGYLMKALNNILFAVNFWSASEALACLSRHGVEPQTALDVLNAASGRSQATQHTIPEEVLGPEPNPAFRLGQLLKDVEIAADAVARSESAHRLLGEVAERYRRLVDAVGFEADAAGAYRGIQDGGS